MCCDNHLTVSNPQSFSGVDPCLHVVTQADIDSVRNALVAQLRKRAWQRFETGAVNRVEPNSPHMLQVLSDSTPGTR
jgi:hypothetical protein